MNKEDDAGRGSRPQIQWFGSGQNARVRVSGLRGVMCPYPRIAPQDYA
jgi:hypothetical protein